MIEGWSDSSSCSISRGTLGCCDVPGRERGGHQTRRRRKWIARHDCDCMYVCMYVCWMHACFTLLRVTTTCWWMMIEGWSDSFSCSISRGSLGCCDVPCRERGRHPQSSEGKWIARHDCDCMYVCMYVCMLLPQLFHTLESNHDLFVKYDCRMEWLLFM